MESMFPVSVVVDGVGLNMTVMSYRDHLDFGIVTDQGQIPDAWPFIDAPAHRAGGAAVGPAPRRADR